MSNPVNTVDMTGTLADFLTANNLLVQKKKDKTGGVVDAAGTNRRVGANWGDFVDDFMIAFFTAKDAGEFSSGSSFDITPAKTTLAIIANQSVATPLGLWNGDGDTVEQVTGGAGFDLTTPGFSGQAIAFEIINGEPLQADQILALWFDGESTAEATGGGVPGTWGLNQDVTVMAWLKRDEQSSASSNDAQHAVTFANRSSATIGTTTTPLYVLGLHNWTAGTTPGQGTPHCGYYDNQGTPALVELGWASGGRNVKTPLGKWVHVCMTRLRNGLDDNDLRLYVNGREVGNMLAQNDAGTPNSANMRLLVGGGRGSTREFKGSIRDVAIWDSVLPAADVLKMYQIGKGDLV